MFELYFVRSVFFHAACDMRQFDTHRDVSDAALVTVLQSFMFSSAEAFGIVARSH